MRRRLTVLPVALAAALVLAGCTGDPAEEAPAPDAPIADIDVCDAPSGDAVESIQVTGEFGAVPSVAFDGGLVVDQTERAVLIQGDTAEEGALFSVAYSFYNGTTGEQILTFGWADGEQPEYLRAGYEFVNAGFAKTLGCLGVGSRAAGVIPVAEGFGARNADYGMAADDTLVMVVDVLNDAEWTDDLPVVGGTAEAPTVTLPATPPVADLRVAVLEEGDGAVVTPASTVSVDYLGTAWDTGEVFDESFSTQPYTLPVTQFVSGFTNALIGQKVGTRVLVTMPPSLGYGEAGTSQHQLAGLTLVFLVDIVAIAG